MPTTLNKAAYQQLIDEDLEWLRQQPGAMERDHIEECLLWLRENRLDKPTEVWLVGGGSGLPDVYASEADAIAAVMSYLFEDEDDHWLGKLSASKQQIVRLLRDHPQQAIEAYNEFVADEDKWFVTEEEVKRVERTDPEEQGD